MTYLETAFLTGIEDYGRLAAYDNFVNFVAYAAAGQSEVREVAIEIFSGRLFVSITAETCEVIKFTLREQSSDLLLGRPAPSVLPWLMAGLVKCCG